LLWHVALLVVYYFASRRLVIDYSAYAARPGASARRAARLAARCRLLRLRRASGCLGRSRLIVDYSVRRDFVLRPHWLYFSHARVSRLLVSRQHWLYINYTARRHNVIF
jgi:IS1 family transposase